ncbi:MAG: glycosyltransferase family 4 protein [Cyanobacteria bacterium REEB459]|nr:glycosyltransferase family 4 protein [Cyanobacteria bacterium REEB459]
MPQADLLINLAFVPRQPTGLAVYALNILPHLGLTSQAVLAPHPLNHHHWQPSPPNATSDDGTWGHGRRLWWTQTRLPQLYQQRHSRLLFSPIPEAPLWSRCHTVVTVHDLIPLRFSSQMSPALVAYCRYYLPRVIGQARHILCNSLATQRDIHEFFGPLATPQTVTPLAYDHRRYQWLDLPRQPYLLYLGRHAPYKNLVRLIQAFAQLPAGATDLELWLGGGGDRRFTPALHAQVDALGLGSRVRFLGYVPEADLPRLINQAVALVFPSLWEGFGLPVLEAMACGTPVITSNLASLPEVAGEAALLIDPYRVEELAAAMAAVWQDSQLWQQLHRAGLERAQGFSWAKTGAATAAVLQAYL